MTVEWLNPATNLGTVIEGDYFQSPALHAVWHIIPGDAGTTTNIKFLVVDRLPDTLALDHTLKVIKGYVTEVDNWYPGFQKPNPFSYDTATVAGGNYASYGSALIKDVVVNFTIRAYYDLTYNPSNPTIGTYADRTFTLLIENDYSSDRDEFIRNYFEGQTLTYNGEELTPDEWIIRQKLDGYYE